MNDVRGIRMLRPGAFCQKASAQQQVSQGQYPRFAGKKNLCDVVGIAEPPQMHDLEIAVRHQGPRVVVEEARERRSVETCRLGNDQRVAAASDQHQ